MKSAGWNDEASTDTPEYEVDPEPLGRCPFEEDCAIVESPTLFVCERKLKEDELSQRGAQEAQGGRARRRAAASSSRAPCASARSRAKRPSTTCARARPSCSTDFTSRFGRPFSATLVLKETGRHGFEFPPRKRAGEEESGARATRRRPQPPRRPLRPRAEEARAREEGARRPPRATRLPPRRSRARKKAPRKNAAQKAAAKKSAAAEE